jgi:hypothetical protein
LVMNRGEVETTEPLDNILKPLTARAMTDGSATILAVVNDGTGMGLTTLWFDQSGTLQPPIRIQLPNQAWVPKAAAIGSDRIYVANARQPYEIAVVSHDGTLMDIWIRDGGWVEHRTDEFGRQRTSILGMHEADSLLLVVTSIRKETARGVTSGSFSRFSAMHDFALEVIDPTNGEVLSTSLLDQPPFYGGVDDGVVYGIVEIDGGNSVTFLSVDVTQGGTMIGN